MSQSEPIHHKQVTSSSQAKHKAKKKKKETQKLSPKVNMKKPLKFNRWFKRTQLQRNVPTQVKSILNDISTLTTVQDQYIRSLAADVVVF